MNIPPKYEDVVAQLESSNKLCDSLERSMKNHRHELGLSMEREAALREELDNHDSASQLMNAWVSEKGQMPWVTAINIMATATKMSDEERQRLLDMDGGSTERRALVAERDALQQRLTVAEQFVQKMVDCTKGQGSIATGYLSDILAALKPTAEREGS